MSRAQRGRVLLVGAGPGDPDLVTVRGAAALRQADAVVYDVLVSDELLDLAPPHAERFEVGSRGCDSSTSPWPETAALLVRLAGEGKTVVCLECGDPFVFGRGGEEATACLEAGIPFEVVPGVSPVVGALACAGIPVADRRHAASLAVVTGEEDPTRVAAETRWDLLGRAADTLVILLGTGSLEAIVGKVLAGGRAPTTPAAAVTSATLPEQRVVEAPLGELVRSVREAGLGAPSVVVVGDVVRLRESLAWFEKRPLFGKRVLVTRAEDQADEMRAALREAGAQAVVVPMIRLVPPESFAEVDAALDRIDGYDALLFTSANAVRFLAARAAERGRPLAGLAAKAVCVGPRTAQAALCAGLVVQRIPESRYDAEGMLAEIEEHIPTAGRRFLLPRAEAAREVLPEGLRAAGASVDAVAVYRNVRPEVDAARLRERLTSGELHALTFTSPSTVRSFAALLDDEARVAAGRCLIAAIGPVTARALRGEGLEPDVTPERASVPDLVAALSARVSAERTGGTR